MLIKELCECIPSWLKPKGGNCDYCEEIGEGRPSAVYPVAFPCAVKSERVHIFTLLFHHHDEGNDCLKHFMAEMTETGQGRFYEPLGLVENIRSFDHEDFLKRHTSLVPYCLQCHVHEQKCAKLSRCAGCRITSYCSKECQKANWPSHKEFCQAKQRGEPDVSVSCEPEKLDNLCPCLSKIGRIYASRQDTNLCSRPGCDNGFVMPITFEMYVETCQAKKDAPPHMYHLHYCSAKCQRHASQMEKGIKRVPDE